jgi:hypothetical protein
VTQLRITHTVSYEYSSRYPGGYDDGMTLDDAVAWEENCTFAELIHFMDLEKPTNHEVHIEVVDDDNKVIGQLHRN